MKLIRRTSGRRAPREPLVWEPTEYEGQQVAHLEPFSFLLQERPEDLGGVSLMVYYTTTVLGSEQVEALLGVGGVRLTKRGDWNAFAAEPAPMDAAKAAAEVYATKLRRQRRVTGRRVEFEPDGRFDPEADFDVEGVKFSPESGFGTAPNNSNVNYMGFAVWMPVSAFLALNPERVHFEQETYRDESSPADFLRAAAAEGRAFGPLTLYVEGSMARGEDTFTEFKVRNHEGRGRATTLQAAKGPDALVPVHVIPHGRQGTRYVEMRARHLSAENLLGLTIKPDHRAERSWARPHTITRITLERKNYSLPTGRRALTAEEEDQALRMALHAVGPGDEAFKRSHARAPYSADEVAKQAEFVALSHKFLAQHTSPHHEALKQRVRAKHRRERLARVNWDVSGQRNRGRHIRLATSPLEYQGGFPQRLALIDPAAGTAPEGDLYFAVTKRLLRFSLRTGRAFKKPKLVDVPGAGDGVVGFIDFTINPSADKTVPVIHFLKVREDARKQGVMRTLVDEFYARFGADARWVEWGDIHHEGAWKLFVERKTAGDAGRGPKSYGHNRC
jgi:hypothetical protein